MIELLIFHLHILGALYVFTKYWLDNRLKDAFLSITVIALFFAIGWSLTGTLANYIFPSSLSSVYFTKDTLSLVLLFIPESIFFYLFFFRDKIIRPEPETSNN